MKLIPLKGRGVEYLKRPVDSNVIWVSRFKKGFGRKEVSTFTSDIGEAKDFRDDLFATWLGEAKRVNKKVKLLAGEHWETWAKTKARKSEAWQDTIKYSGKHLLPYIQNMYPEEITGTWWENTYIPKKTEDTHAGRKFYNDWKCLTTFLKFLHNEGHLEKKPKIEEPDEEPEAGLRLSIDETAALYEYENEDLRLQQDLGLEHYMRISEVLLLPWAEIDFKARLIRLPAKRTKIRKARDIPLNDKVLHKLKARKATSDSPYVFPSPTKKDQSVGRSGNRTAWANAIREANFNKCEKCPNLKRKKREQCQSCSGTGWIEKPAQRIRPETTFHDLRHTGLTRAFKVTNRYAEVCKMAGLSLDEAYKTYVHFDAEDTRFVADLVSQFKPELDKDDQQ